MTISAHLLSFLVPLAIVAFACRAGGFWLMRYVPLTPRVKAALGATPLAVMIGITIVASLRGAGLWT